MSLLMEIAVGWGAASVLAALGLGRAIALGEAIEVRSESREPSGRLLRQR